MTALYLFCLIVGGGLLLVSVLGLGGDADADGGLELDADADAPGSLTADVDASWEGDSGAGFAREFFSIRALFYFLAGFGATGLLLDTGTAASPLTALLFALLTGTVAALIAGGVYGLARRSESGLVPTDHEHLVGQPAQVILPVVAGRRGKIRFVQSGREVELLARLYGPDEADCPRGATVLIVDVEGDTALVTSAPSFLPDLS